MVSCFGPPIRRAIRAVGYEQETLSVRRKSRVPIFIFSRERDRYGFSPVVAYLFGQANDAIVGEVHSFTPWHKRRSRLPIRSRGTVLHKNGRFGSLHDGKASLANTRVYNKGAKEKKQNSSHSLKLEL